MTKVKGEQTSPKAKRIKTEDRENADDADIYSDVLASQDAIYEKLQQEVQKLRNEKSLLIKSLDSLQKSYEKLQKEFEELEIKYKIIAYNSSALFKTAQAEISRKDKTIQAVRREKDDLLFRRSSSVRTSSRLRRSAIVSPRKLRTPIVSPRKLRTPLKKRTTSNQPKLGLEDSTSLPEQGNESDGIKTYFKESVQTSPENINAAEQSVQIEDVKVISVEDDKEEKVQCDPFTKYVPPTIQGPITMYSKRLYKKMHGVSPQKVPPPMEALKSNVTRLPNNLEVPATKTNKQAPIEVSGQRHPLERVSPTDSLKSNIRVRYDSAKELSPSRVTDKQLPMKLAGQECASPNECKTPSLTSKLRLETQEFIKLGSNLKPCKSGSPQEVIIDLRKLPKENCKSSDLVREILNTTYGLIPDRSRSTSTTTKNWGSGGMRNSTERVSNITFSKEEIKSQIQTPEVETLASNNEKNLSKDVIRTSSHETPRVSNRNRPRANNNINKTVITPATFGKLVSHEPPKVTAKTGTRQTTSFVADQPDESRKRKLNCLSPTESISPVTVQQHPVVDALKSGKKSKLISSLFGESPLKSDTINTPILDRKSPSPTLLQIFPNSPSLDSDDPEDLVIDTTACSINSSPRLSESEHKDEAEHVKINAPFQEVLEVNSKTSSKSTHSNLYPLTNSDNQTDQLKKPILKRQNTLDSKKALSNYGLPDLSECYSLDNEIRLIKDPRLVNRESHNVKLDICLSSNTENLSTIVQPESKSGNIHVVCNKEDTSMPTRFVPSPPQLSSGVSGLNHSENSLLYIGDTMDLVSKLALTNVRDISPLRTPDKKNNAPPSEIESDLDNQPSGHMFSESSSPNVIDFSSIEKIIQILAVSNGEINKTNNDLSSSVDLKNEFTKNLATALNNDCVLNKTNISEQMKDKPLGLDCDESKFTQPQNEFKRRRPVRRLDSHSKIENNSLATNTNNENVESKAVNSNLSHASLSVESTIKQIVVEKVQDNLQVQTTQTMDSLRNDNNDPNSMIMSKVIEHVRLAPFLSNELDHTDKTSSEITSQLKQFLNTHLMKGIDTKTDENKSNPEVIVQNMVSNLKEHYRLIPIDGIPIKSTEKTLDVILKENGQLNTSLLQADLDKSSVPSGLVHPNIILMPMEQTHLKPDNVISKTENTSSDLILQLNKESNPPHLPETNIIVNKSTSEAMPSKLISKSQNNLTPFLFEIINKGKSNQLINPNLQKENNTKNEVNIPTSKTVDLSTVNSKKITPVICRENVLSKAKYVVQNLPIKSTTLDIEKKTYKPSSSIKTMGKPLQRVKYDPLNKSKTSSCAQKQAVNTNKELEEMPHIARINQKVRISSYQGNKEQTSLHMHPPKDKTSPVIINSEKVSLDRVAKFTLPAAFSTPIVDKNSVRMKRPREISMRNREKVSRRSVSVDRVIIRRKMISPIIKQPRSKSNTRGNCDVNEPIPEHSVRRVPSRSPSPLQKIIQQHSRRSQSLSPGRKRSSNSDMRVLSKSPSPSQEVKFQRHSRRSQSISPGRRRSSNSGKRVLSKSPSPLKKVKFQLHSRRSQSLSPGRRRSSNSGKRVLSKSPSPSQEVKFQRHSRRSQSISPGRRRSSNSGKRVLSKSPSPLKKVKFQLDSRRSQSLSPGRRRSSNSGKRVLSKSPSPSQEVKFQRHSRRSQSLSPSRRRSSNSGKRVINKSPSPLQKVKFQLHSRRSQSISPGRRRSSNSGKRVLSRSPSPLQTVKFQRHSRRSQSISPGRRRSSNSGKRVLSKSPSPLQKVKFQRHSRRSQSISPGRRRSSNSGKRVLSRSPSPLQKVKFQRHSRRSQSISPGRRRSSNSGKRVLSRSPSPLQKGKFQRHSRRSQSLSPVRRRSSQRNTRQTEDKIPIARNSSRPRNNSQYHETDKDLPNPEPSRSSSNSPERTSRSKSNYMNKTRESDSPEQKLSSRSFHQSRRMYNDNPAEGYRYRNRKRSRSPQHRSNSRNYRERSHSPEYRRYNRNANPRDRSRNQHERSRSRSPPDLHYKKLPTCQTPAEPDVLPSGSYRNSKRWLSQSEQNNESETGTDKVNKSCRQLSGEYSKIDREEIIALRKELELLKGKLIENVDNSQEKDHKQINKMQSTEIVGTTDVTSRSVSPRHSCHLRLSSQTSDQREISLSSGSQGKIDQTCVNPSSEIHPQNCRINFNSQQMVITKESEENSITPNDSESARTKHELTSHVQVKRIKRKTRNLGDSDVNVVSATKINERL